MRNLCDSLTQKQGSFGRTTKTTGMSFPPGTPDRQTQLSTLPSSIYAGIDKFCLFSDLMKYWHDHLSVMTTNYWCIIKISMKFSIYTYCLATYHSQEMHQHSCIYYVHVLLHIYLIHKYKQRSIKFLCIYCILQWLFNLTKAKLCGKAETGAPKTENIFCIKEPYPTGVSVWGCCFIMGFVLGWFCKTPG